MQQQGTVDHPLLVGHGGRVQSGTGAGQRQRRQVEQRATQRRGGGGVADAHLAADIHPGPRLVRTLGTGAPGGQRRAALFVSHGRATGEVGGTGAEAVAVHTTERLAVAGSAQVDDLETGLQLVGEHADGGAAGDEVVQHLPGDRLRIGGNALLDHPVVAGEHGDPRLF
ncbi:hypothetical protein D3C81_1762840 [compost metagenome]